MIFCPFTGINYKALSNLLTTTKTCINNDHMKTLKLCIGLQITLRENINGQNSSVIKDSALTIEKVWILVERIREKHKKWQIGNNYLCPRTCYPGSNLKLVIGGLNTQPYTDGSGKRKGLVYRG